MRLVGHPPLTAKFVCAVAEHKRRMKTDGEEELFDKPPHGGHVAGGRESGQIFLTKVSKQLCIGREMEVAGGIQ